ncbi:solute carrier family 46 member 3-like isoform X2 [Dreissena polymorpha]|uniref:Major facilitator superfamily (MFS) profile domain-containing protein n=2 Tax=Dreissena polymorpha TaxID=45954 RepID=A0A9D4LZW0_DREPO|nr:solute carrier family 46 member 3-like isoform X2 [Dreissena polymorpha]KAH3868237.1 hypothetical protein DPMN_031378 [Dreissena polymorpha]
MDDSRQPLLTPNFDKDGYPVMPNTHWPVRERNNSYLNTERNGLPNMEHDSYGSIDRLPLGNGNMDDNGRANVDTTVSLRVEYKGFTRHSFMVVPMILLYFFSAGVIGSLLPQYTQFFKSEEIAGRDPVYSKHKFNACAHVNHSDPGYQIYVEIQQETAKWTLYFSIASLVPSLLGNLIFIPLSDIYGRKFVFLLTLIGAIVKHGLSSYVVYYKLDLSYFIIGQVFDAISGSYMTFLAMMFTYTCDLLSSGKGRTIGIVMMELLLGIIFTATSFLTGYLLEWIGFFWPLALSTFVLVLALILLVFCVPETLPISNKLAVTNKRPFVRLEEVFQSMLEAFKFYFTHKSKLKRLKYILLIGGFTFMCIPYMNRGTMEVLYQLGQPFCWSATKIGWFSAFKIGIAAMVAMVGTFLMQKCLADDSIAMVGISGAVISYIVEGLATSDFVLYMVPVLTCSSGLPIPMIRSLMSSLTPAEKQGAVFGSIGAVETFCSLIGALSNNVIYIGTIKIMNGFVFLIMGAITCIGVVFILAYMYVARTRIPDDRHEITTNEIIVDAS